MDKLKILAAAIILVIVGFLLMTFLQPKEGINDILAEEGIELGDYGEKLETGASVTEIEDVKKAVLSSSDSDSLKAITMIKLSITQQEKMIEERKEELGRIPTSDYCRKLVAAEKVFSLQKNKLELLELMKEKIGEYNNKNLGQEIEFDEDVILEEREVTEKQKNAVELLDSLC